MGKIFLICFGLFIFISNPGTPTFGILLGLIAVVLWQNRDDKKLQEKLEELEEEREKEEKATDTKPKEEEN